MDASAENGSSGSSQKMERPVYIRERSPQQLNRNLDRSTGQVSLIAGNPSETQIQQVSHLLQDRGPQDGESIDPQVQAREFFTEVADLISARQAAEEEFRRLGLEYVRANKSEAANKRKAYYEARDRREAVRELLGAKIQDLRAAGVQVEPSQLPEGVEDRAHQAAFGLGWQIAAGQHRAGEMISGAGRSMTTRASEVRSGIVSGAEAARERARQQLESGRTGLIGLFGRGQDALRAIREAGADRFDQLRTAISSRREAVGDRLSSVGRAGTEASTTLYDQLRIASAKRIEAVGEMTKRAQSSAREMIASARKRSSDTLNGFMTRMTQAGEGLRNGLSSASSEVQNFLGSQADRIRQVEQNVASRITAEVREALSRGRVFLAPAWENIQNERQEIRENSSILVDKMTVAAEQVSEIANPIIDRILDQGRDTRDRVVGFSRRHIQAAQVFGRNAVGGVQESLDPVWQAMTERWENMRLRRNEAATRLNGFLTGVLGVGGQRFQMLSESFGRRTERAQQLLNGMRVEGGRIVRDEVGEVVEAGREVARLFAEKGVMAGELLRRSKENVASGIESLRRYWEVYAVNRWREAKLPDLEVERRLKVLRAVGAASADRAGKLGTIGAAGAIEGTLLVQKIVRDPRGRVLIGLGAVALLLATHPEMLEHFQSIPDAIGSMFGGNEASTDMSGLIGPDLPQISGPGEVGSAPDVVLADAAPDVSAASPPELPKADDQSPIVPDRPSAPGERPAAPAAPSPASVQPQPPVAPEVPVAPPAAGPEFSNVLSQIQVGQPVEAQIDALVGGTSPEKYEMLEQVFNGNLDNFRSTAQAIIRGEGGPYSQDMMDTAHRQLNAINQLSSAGDIDPSSQQGYSLLKQAMNYWRPV